MAGSLLLQSGRGRPLGTSARRGNLEYVFVLQCKKVVEAPGGPMVGGITNAPDPPSLFSG